MTAEGFLLLAAHLKLSAVTGVDRVLECFAQTAVAAVELDGQGQMNVHQLQQSVNT